MGPTIAAFLAALLVLTLTTIRLAVQVEDLRAQRTVLRQQLGERKEHPPCLT